ncbi:MAG: PTS sugar transporter subunit IIB [Anaerolineae bacterium]|jgi:PTS system ascorbate-specific IIB component|nr:PTS sugar transporter subunit IIB [Anaerolineae bacterium]
MATILATCANGAGSSLLMKMAVEKVVKELNMNVTKVHHCAISEGKSTAKNFDIVFCPLNFKNMFEDAEKNGVAVIGLKNVMSADEIKKGLIELGLDVKYKK